MAEIYLGVDIGTSSSKGVLVDTEGRVLASAIRGHEVKRPAPGQVEMDAEIWWDEFTSISRELIASAPGEIAAVGVSGMGPCVLVTDQDGLPLRPAILYGIDTRATEQIAALNRELGASAVIERGGSALSTQAVGPKLQWIADREPAVAARMRRLFMPSSWLAWRLTGQYQLDHHSASQSNPLYDSNAMEWFEPWAEQIAPGLSLPRLVWPGEIVGQVTENAAETTGLPVGIPVIAGTIDAWSEAISVGAQRPGDLMLMYGTTMFLINTLKERITVPELWGTIGAFPGTRNLAGGMATSGAITSWLRELAGGPDFAELVAAAASSPAGARGLLMLPYFAGERTPISDPDARGAIIGLSLEHTMGDIYRAALEATAMGVRHNVEAIRSAGGDIRRVVAVGGGVTGRVWAQIVSDVTGLRQEIRRVSIGASYGAAFLAASALGEVRIDSWNPLEEVIEPRPELAADYDELFRLYLEFYPRTVELMHALAQRQRQAGFSASV
ncbi:MAG: sugar kinase [Cryobacterium sp.]|nr:sugar kinase [Cryobacterium sp.]